MLKDTFYLDGVDARSVGIYLQKPLEFDGIKPIVYKQHIPGRNGDLIFDTGAFENRKGQAACFLLSLDDIPKANAFFLKSSGYRKLTCSNDPGYYWMARVLNGVSTEPRMNVLNPFKVKFDCKPQHFLESGNTPITFSNPGSGIRSEIVNPFSGIAKPLIEVQGAGWKLNVTVGGIGFSIADNTDGAVRRVFLDSDTCNAYDDHHRNINDLVTVVEQTGTDEYPLLRPGRNPVFSSDSVSSIKITPRWWDK